MHLNQSHVICTHLPGVYLTHYFLNANEDNHILANETMPLSSPPLELLRALQQKIMKSTCDRPNETAALKTGEPCNDFSQPTQPPKLLA